MYIINRHTGPFRTRVIAKVATLAKARQWLVMNFKLIDFELDTTNNIANALVQFAPKEIDVVSVEQAK